MKRILSVVLVLLLLSSVLVPVSANTDDNSMSPRFTYISKVSTNVSIDQSIGLATCTAVTRADGVASIKLICRLQQKKDGAWVTIKSWSDTGTQQAGLAKQYAVYSGYSYRTYVTSYVYNAAGTLLETASCYSNAQYY